jgi:hypothetical protein
MTQQTGRPTVHGLYQPRQLVCACGAEFTAKAPQATYCGNECRIKYGRFGRTYGTIVPRQFGVTKS